MKQLIKKLARSLWRISDPVSRPVIQKFDAHMMRLLGSASLRADPTANLDLALRSVVRELARLHMQVEILQQQIDDLQSSVSEGVHNEIPLSTVDEIGPPSYLERR
jgi:hypothetical protein